ncbi:MAG: hypothetical protein ACREA3_09825 [Nitrosotalea sp.]
MKTNRKPIREILKMSERELSEYLRETDNTLGPTDSAKIIPFEHGIKVLFFHKNKEKPFKTRVYLDIENPDVLK